MKTTVIIFILLFSPLVLFAQVENNVALSVLGATAEDNGSFDDYGTDQDAVLAKDSDTITYWAGLQASSPQQMWITFDKTYSIDEIHINEYNNAYMKTGIVEYFNGTDWNNLLSIDKTTSDLTESFAAVEASKIRITVYTLTAPGTWYNKVACIYAVEVNESSSTSINSNNLLHFNIYPNPTSGNVEVLSADFDDYSAVLYDCLGKELLREIFNYKLKIDISDYSNGMYLLEIRNNSNSLILEKIIKQ